MDQETKQHIESLRELVKAQTELAMTLSDQNRRMAKMITELATRLDLQQKQIAGLKAREAQRGQI